MYNQRMVKNRDNTSARTHHAVVMLCFVLAALFVIGAAIRELSAEETGNPTASSHTGTLSHPSSSPSQADSSAFEAYFIDVGQGDCTLLISPSGRTMLIDGGEAGNYDTISDYMELLNIESIDVMVATHAHSDHIGSLSAIVEAYEVDTFYMTKYDSSSKTYENLMDVLEERDVCVEIVSASFEAYIPWDDEVTVRILSPIEEVRYPNLNDSSIVLKCTYGTQSLLLTGDIEDFAEEQMLEVFSPDVLRSTVLKVAHHGAETSSTEAFISAVSPQAAIISVGDGNTYGHPRMETLQRLRSHMIDYYRTDESGTILVSFTPRSFVVTPGV
ncbi:MAG: ComEC/Rec2 family competence protein [Clostridia bacterium]|nr:ComEC/Rec2 family competence protein [Clostridia bacterium]